MVANGIGLTNRYLTPVKGQAAFLPNQPILHNCVVTPTAETALEPGDVVTFADDANMDDVIVVKQAAETDEPLGVVVYNALKSGFAANDKISVFPDNSYVYMEAGAADITRGAKLGFNADNQVVTATAGNGVIGKACTVPGVTGDLIVVQVKPSMEAGA